MTNLIQTGPIPANAIFAPSSIALPCDIGLQVLHFTNLANVITVNSVRKSIDDAYRNAPASTINGSPTIDAQKLTIVTKPTDSFTTAITDNTGDFTLYVGVLNLDTLANAQAQPILGSTFGGAHGFHMAYKSTWG